MFRSKRSALISTFVGGFFLLVFYQNMTPVEFSTLNMPAIDENARKDQAQELLGSHYIGSVAQSLEGQRDLNYLVFKKLEASLAKEWTRWIPQLTKELIRESKSRDMDPIFVLAIIQTESQFNTYAKGTSGEIGLMQILPQTGEWIAKKYNIPWNGPNTLYDPIANVKIGIAYFSYLRSQFESRAHHYVPAYNMGPKNVRRVARDIASVGEDERTLLNGIYGSKVMRNYQMIYQQMVAVPQPKGPKVARANGGDETTETR
ncbi:lytic transglycosylase domain-containing protein [Bdellovibrio sp. HCB2-146]|uniref:lytic transglycosylase domain-containing protein n=1 Tax=Bdellovibrio sp. HCB2-146 TaxID=3394362 RepID=UPI0039BD84E5